METGQSKKKKFGQYFTPEAVAEFMIGLADVPNVIGFEGRQALFKSKPSDLYINWAAAMQIQFHVCDLEQDFNGSVEDWAKAYLKHFVAQARKRADDMIRKFVEPFEKYLN